ncbi:MAG: ribose 5-phosphate isomerase B [Bacteroidetes bacterium GWA2_30_7]|nr:MAG: ribose 5-phosphate isomerase B [Bacteroidetes bacterium GWA2_30_7]
MYKSVGLACDHAGYLFKEKIKNYLNEKGIVTIDFGTYSEQCVDYPDFAHKLANAIENKEVEIGFSFCGSGNGINMAANKHKEIRSALCWNAEISKFAKLHNDANICAIPARFIDEKVAFEIVDEFLKTQFEGGRHAVRVEKIKIK